MRGQLLTAITVAVAVSTALPATATVVRVPSLARLVRHADLVVVTEVIDVRSENLRDRDASVPTTIVRLRVHETLKGPPRLQLVLELPGASPDGDVEVTGQPRFALGSRDVLFLVESGRRLSPVPGVFAGRFRLRAGLDEAAVLASEDGRALSGDLAGTLRPAARGERPLTLPGLRATVRDALRDPRVVEPGTPGPDDYRGVALSPPPSNAEGSGSLSSTCLVIELGASPALRDGCRDWACAARRAAAAAVPDAPPRVLQPADSVDGCNSVQRVRWAHEVLGRSLDEFTLAVRVDRSERGLRSTDILLNRTLSWDSMDATAAAGNSASVDAYQVFFEELSAQRQALTDVSPAAVSAHTGRPSASEPGRAGWFDRIAAAGPGAEPSRVLALDACQGDAGVVLNPTLLIFDSADHDVITSYEVGIFAPGGQVPLGIVDVPLTAFYQRRTIDLPPDAAEEFEQRLVVNIAAAGLSTPAGRLVTYRVRGVWKGGRTDWSTPSPPFARCPF